MHGLTPPIQSLRRTWIRFNGRRPHCTMPFTGPYMHNPERPLHLCAKPAAQQTFVERCAVCMKTAVRDLRQAQHPHVENLVVWQQEAIVLPGHWGSSSGRINRSNGSFDKEPTNIPSPTPTCDSATSMPFPPTTNRTNILELQDCDCRLVTLHLVVRVLAIDLL